MSIVADQRKRSNQQSKSNVAAQQNTSNNQQKKNNKQNLTQNPIQNPREKEKEKEVTAKPTPAPITTVPNKTSISPEPQPEPHTSLQGFNGDAIDKLLAAAVNSSAEQYKTEKPTTQKPGPWGQKAGQMASGKDFWLELRKQVATLQKGSNLNKGG